MSKLPNYPQFYGLLGMTHFKNNPLHSAIEIGDFDLVKDLLNKGTTIYPENFALACEKGRKEIIHLLETNFLQDENLNQHMFYSEGLLGAIRGGDLELVKQIRRHCDLSITPEPPENEFFDDDSEYDHSIPLVEAIRYKKFAIVHYLFHEGAKKKPVKEALEMTDLIFYATIGDVNKVKAELAKEDILIDEFDIEGFTAKDRAVQAGHSKIQEILEKREMNLFSSKNNTLVNTNFLLEVMCHPAAKVAAAILIVAGVAALTVGSLGAGGMFALTGAVYFALMTTGGASATMGTAVLTTGFFETNCNGDSLGEEIEMDFVATPGR